MFNVNLHRQSQKTQPYTKGIAKLYEWQALACLSLEARGTRMIFETINKQEITNNIEEKSS